MHIELELGRELISKIQEIWFSMEWDMMDTPPGAGAQDIYKKVPCFEVAFMDVKECHDMQLQTFFIQHNPGKRVLVCTKPHRPLWSFISQYSSVLVPSSCPGGAGQRVLEVFEVESFQMVPKLHRSILAYQFCLEGSLKLTVRTWNTGVALSLA